MPRPKLQTKVCKICYRELPRFCFYTRTYSRNGKRFSSITHRCRDCEKAIAKKARKDRAAQRRMSGQCLLCTLPTEEGKTLCRDHVLSEYLRVKLVREATKLSAIEFLGGTCVDCGLRSKYTSVYDFHHRDPSTKMYNISNRKLANLESIKDELLKCDLLCANCHRIRHEVQVALRMGAA